MKGPLTAFAFAVAVIVLAMAMPARGQVVLGMHQYADNGYCPPHRPHKRIVTQYPSSMTLVACLPRLVCGPERCAQETVVCNRSNGPVDVEICLSDAELERAR